MFPFDSGDFWVNWDLWAASIRRREESLELGGFLRRTRPGMGNLDSWQPLADADASGGHDLPCSHPQPPNPHPSVIKVENWRRAEEATREVLWCIRPTVVSEERRKAVVDYVQELLMTRMGSKVSLLCLVTCTICSNFDYCAY